MSLLLYGVVDGGHPVVRAEEPLGDPGSVVVVEEDLAVVAGTLPDPGPGSGPDDPDGADLSDDDAVRHLDVLVALVNRGPVLPLRFGTLAPDAEAVREEVLRPGLEEFRRNLDAVRDLVELRLDLSFDEQAAIRALYAADPSLRRMAGEQREGRGPLADQIEFGRYVAERLAERRAETVAAWRERLAAVTERTAARPGSDEGVERLVLLARRDALAAVDAAVGALRGAAVGELDAEYVGPLPVLTFADDVSARPEEPRSRWGW